MYISDLDRRTLVEFAYCHSRFQELAKQLEQLHHERNLLDECIMEKKER